jgi:hypothetical protein
MRRVGLLALALVSCFAPPGRAEGPDPNAGSADRPQTLPAVQPPAVESLLPPPAPGDAAFGCPLGGPSGVGVLLVTPPNPLLTLKPEMGFAYVQPRWGRGLGVVPGPEDLNYGVVFYPRLDLQVVYIDDKGKDHQFVVSASYLRLEGNRREQLTATGGSTATQADSRVELIAADLVGKRWSTWHLKEPEDHCWLDAVVAIRYASTSQRFSSQTTSGGVVTSGLNATQSFSGLGVSTAGGLRIPLVRDADKLLPDKTSPLKLYADVRGSLLIGDNHRTSTFQAGGPDALTIERDERDLVPVGELEMGIAWGTARVGFPGSWADPTSATVIGIKAAAVGQVWGDVGFISAARPPATRLSGGNLYLYGAIVTFYLSW